MTERQIHWPLLATALSLGASACAVGPHYQRPAIDAPQAYKEWKPAEPSAPDIKSDWWRLFGDDLLNSLEERVIISNQNLAASEAAYQQARGQVRADVANLFPSIDVSGSGTSSKANGVQGNRYQANVGGTWDVDLWGQLRKTVSASRALAQASAGDLAAATLSAQSELAMDYIQLRAADEQKRLLDAEVANEKESLRIAENRFQAGVAAAGDVASAQSQLATVQAQAIDVGRQRATFEHAIAVLIGQAPGDFSIPVAGWTLKPVDIPTGLPSQLLERRPDIAAAERRAASANARIGVAVSAFFPSLTLTGTYGGAAATIADIATAPARSWSFGAAAADTLFNFGGRVAKVKIAKEGYKQAVAQYRQTVLTAFENVEDALSAEHVLNDEQHYRQIASSSADQAERIANNQYQAGTIDHTALIVAQNAAHTARINELAIESARLTNMVSLIEAIGGGWRAPS